jgi:hypothetical protein
MSFLRGKNRRLFSKCSLKYLVLVQKNKLIPVTRIFNTQNFEGKMNEILKKKKKGKSAFNPILRLVFSEVFLNIFRNQNFRIFIFALIKNLKYLFQKKYSLLNPFFTIAVTVVPSVENIDYKFLEECNIHSINSEDTKPKPACLYRIKKYC